MQSSRLYTSVVMQRAMQVFRKFFVVNTFVGTGALTLYLAVSLVPVCGGKRNVPCC
jgi:hypothetical protein